MCSPRKLNKKLSVHRRARWRPAGEAPSRLDRLALGGSGGSFGKTPRTPLGGSVREASNYVIGERGRGGIEPLFHSVATDECEGGRRGERPHSHPLLISTAQAEGVGRGGGGACAGRPALLLAASTLGTFVQGERSGWPHLGFPCPSPSPLFSPRCLTLLRRTTARRRCAGYSPWRHAMTAAAVAVATSLSWPPGRSGDPCAGPGVPYARVRYQVEDTPTHRHLCASCVGTATARLPALPPLLPRSTTPWRPGGCTRFPPPCVGERRWYWRLTVGGEGEGRDGEEFRARGTRGDRDGGAPEVSRDVPTTYLDLSGLVLKLTMESGTSRPPRRGQLTWTRGIFSISRCNRATRGPMVQLVNFNRRPHLPTDVRSISCHRTTPLRSVRWCRQWPPKQLWVVSVGP